MRWAIAWLLIGFVFTSAWDKNVLRDCGQSLDARQFALLSFVLWPISAAGATLNSTAACPKPE